MSSDFSFGRAAKGGVRSSGTFDIVESHASALSELAAAITTPSSSELTNGNEHHDDGEGQALESHEVVELQAFSERKDWILEKIKLLERMPPVEVFAFSNAVHLSEPTIPGLPTRAELAKWVEEHDKVVQETEIFDSGELRKLKKITKAAAHRNLSPEDTDLIELALTTIYELDKLLHLLRDRTENLELLGVRLTWEERRRAAWTELSKLQADLNAFLTTRARWSSSVYQDLVPPPPSSTNFTLARRSSVISLSSVSSEISLGAPALSRSVRYKVADLLTKDAAQLSGRITTLRHGNVHSAGKALDKLIDRKEVPTEILDEQDRLEEKAVGKMENVGKFIMAVVMQWKKADECYVENLKDQTAARSLFEDIENAKLAHPTARQSSSFATRSAALHIRLTSRGDPSSNFLRPLHPFFADQHASNDDIVQTLSEERACTLELLGRVQASVTEYQSACEAIKRVDALKRDSDSLAEEILAITERLEQGFSTTDGDGSPPDLSSEHCLNHERHSTFLALFPSTLDNSRAACDKASQLLRNFTASAAFLDGEGFDPQYKKDASTAYQRLHTARSRAMAAQDDAVSRVSLLREARRIWAAVEDGVKRLESVRREIAEGMERDKWRRQSSSHGLPLTPESPMSAVSDAPASVAAIEYQLDELQSDFLGATTDGLESITGRLEPGLQFFLIESAEGFAATVEALEQQARTWQKIQSQHAAMDAVKAESDQLQLRIEAAKLQFDDLVTRILNSQKPSTDPDASEAELSTELSRVQQAVTIFTAGLASRVPFLSITQHPSSERNVPRKRHSIPQQLTADRLRQKLSTEPPFDLATLDNIVRTDCNSYSMMLAGELQSLAQRKSRVAIGRAAKEVDAALSPVAESISDAEGELIALKAALEQLPSVDLLPRLTSLAKETEDLAHDRRTKIARSFSPVRHLLHHLESISSLHDHETIEVMVVARRKAVDYAESRLTAWSAGIAEFQTNVSQACQAEMRLEEARIQEERMKQEELARLAVEEKVRLEREALERERERLERERLAREEEARLGLERQERERLERERLASEEEARLALERLKEEEARLREEQERLELQRLRREEEERIKQKQLEREERERKEREAEQLRAQQEAEHRAVKERERLEQERIRLERKETLRLEREEAERLEQIQLERELLEQEERERLEKLRLEEAEQARLESERLERERLEREELARFEKARLEQAEREELERLREAQEKMERLEHARLKEQQERDRLEKLRMEREEAERLEQEKRALLRERLEREERDRLEKLRLEREESIRLEKERSEQEMREQLERQRLEREQSERLAREERARLEKERREQEERERLEQSRLQLEEEERLEREKRALLEKKRLEQEEQERLEQARLVLEEADRVRLEKERLVREGHARLEQEAQGRREKLRKEQAKLEREERTRLEKERLDREERDRLAKERLEQQERDHIAPGKMGLMVEPHRNIASEGMSSNHKAPFAISHGRDGSRGNIFFPSGDPASLEGEPSTGKHLVVNDVFQEDNAPTASASLDEDLAQAMATILSLRKRLQALNINAIARPIQSMSSALPDEALHQKLSQALVPIYQQAESMRSIHGSSVKFELRSLELEIDGTDVMMERILKLSQMSSEVRRCDGLLSDLLEHVDSYPSPPVGPLTSTYAPSTHLPPEEQVSARLLHTQAALDEMTSLSIAVSDDRRAIAERTRLLQTWSELEEMAKDRVQGKKSRPASVVSSSGRDSQASTTSNTSMRSSRSVATPVAAPPRGKAHDYFQLSSRTPERSAFLAPQPASTPRRVVSSGNEAKTRSSSRLSVASTSRSVSGGVQYSSSSTARLQKATFSSRQRTLSNVSSTSSLMTPTRPAAQAPQRQRHMSTQRSDSPLTSSQLSSRAPSMLSSSHGPSTLRSSTTQPHTTWGRSPRIAFPAVPGNNSPKQKTGPVKRKEYVPNPRNKLDVAVGEVVNQLPQAVDINVELAERSSWKDQSGKYWIGGQEPKLCFCRILRSQTVMVRVGGGWTELSKFIKEHFTDVFRLLPDAPSRHNSLHVREEKWISATTLQESPENPRSPPLPPRTPEPAARVPAFALTTPSSNVKSPHSVRATPPSGSPGSPLRAIQFMRRAEVEPDTPGRPTTPTKAGSHRAKVQLLGTPRGPAWRP